MKLNARLIGAGLICFIVFTMASVPARLLTDLVASDGVRIVGVTGSIWNGEINGIETPAMILNTTSWSVNATDLLVGRLGARVETEWPGGVASADVGIGISGRVGLHDVEASGPLTPFLQTLNLPVAGGNFILNFTKLEFVDAWPRSAVGSIRVGNLPLSLPGTAGGPTGSYEVSFDADPVREDGRIDGSLADLSGPLAISGMIVLSPPTNYEIDARIKARPDAPAHLSQGVQFLGPPDADGSREFKMSGSL
jgi:general secretion pathway protein N